MNVFEFDSAETRREAPPADGSRETDSASGPRVREAREKSIQTIHRQVIDASMSFEREMGVLIKMMKPMWIVAAERIVISLTQVDSKRTRNPKGSFKMLSVYIERKSSSAARRRERRRAARQGN